MEPNLDNSFNQRSINFIPNIPTKMNILKNSKFWLLLIITCISAELPSSFKKCNRKQTNFNDCLKIAVQDGIKQLNKPMPEIGLPSLEPFACPDFSIGPGEQMLRFQQNYENVRIHGLTSCNVTNLSLNFENNTFNLDCFFEALRHEFTYNFDGKLLLIPFTGKGPGSVVLKNFTFSFTFNLKQYEKDGEKYFKAIDNHLTWIPGRIKVQLSNLSEKNVLGGGLTRNVPHPSLNSIFNEKAILLLLEVKEDYEEFYGNVYMSLLNNVLETVSLSQLFD